MFYQAKNCIISHKYRFIFVSNCRVAGTSLKKALTRPHEKPEGNRVLMSFKVSSEEIENVQNTNFPQLKLKYPDYFSFTFVRNPWDRVVSAYVSKICNSNLPGGQEWETVKHFPELQGKISFEKFVYFLAANPVEKADRHWFDQYYCIHDEREHLLTDFVGRFERLEEDFSQLINRFKINLCLPYENKSERLPWKDYYTKKLAGMIEKRYEKDIRLFGYRMA